MQTISQLNKKQTRPIKILQYGEGNFLRGFVDYMVDIANEKGVLSSNIAVIKPIAFGNLSFFNEQECTYTVILRGKQDGQTLVEKRVVTAVECVLDVFSQYDAYANFAKEPQLRIVISNTTEAGIVFDDSDDMALCPPKSYPGKLTKLLYERFVAFDGAKDKGLIVIPVELIEKNGTKLRDCVLNLAQLWKLPQSFNSWIMEDNIFCNTLVDRIITGYPKDEAEKLESELGYNDKLIVTGEPFALWVIECDKPDIVSKEFPLDKAGLPVIFTNDSQPYRERKVKLLNGAHTSTVLAAYLAGLDTVGQCMNDTQIRAYIEKVVYGEISPTVPLPAEEVKQFADSVMERFENPFIKHNLLSIALNSVSKFRSRILPSLKDSFTANGKLPDLLCFSYAALIAFYCGKTNDDGTFSGLRGSDAYDISDDDAVIEFFKQNATQPANILVELISARTDFWGEDLTKLDGFCDKVSNYLQTMRNNNMRAAIEAVLK